VSIEYHPIS